MQSAANTTWLAPAKLNLFLHITGRRADGYHLLQTVFQLLDYGDELSFDINNTGVIAMRSPVAGVDDADNLIIRAARLLQTHTGCGSGATIDIKKVLPMGGGLGGGRCRCAGVCVRQDCMGRRCWRRFASGNPSRTMVCSD